MSRFKDIPYLSIICLYLSLFLKKLLNFVTMRRLLSRLMNRVLLPEPFTPMTGKEAEIHTLGLRRMVVGLGNPGMEGTRHSVGMAVLGALAARLGVAERWRGDKHVSGEVIVREVEQTRVVLLRPRLLMNINGVSVAKAASKYGVRPEDILLVHDDLDKPLGKIVIKHGGSARGHNGVRSCVECLQTDVMLRLRVGIGRPPEKRSVERHVLGRFSSEEKKVLDSVLVQSVDLLLSKLLPSQQEAQQEQEEAQSPSSPAGGSSSARTKQERKEGERSDSEASAASQSST